MLKKLKILDAKVPLYSKIDLKNRIPGFLNKNEIIVQIKKNQINGNIWRKIRLFKQNAYIHNANVFEFCSAYIKEGNLDIYSQPSHDARVKKILKTGQGFIISEDLKDWYEIRIYNCFNGMEDIGFVQKRGENIKIEVRKVFLDLGWYRDINVDRATIWSLLGTLTLAFVIYEILPNFNGRIQHALFFMSIFSSYFLIEKIIRKNI